MVFESVVVDILNRYLKPYVKRLDTSQLKVGVWKGHARLGNLELKEDLFAEADLDVPIRIKASYIGELEMKIPWKKLTKDPLIVSIDEVYVVLGPQLETHYDAERDEKRLRKEKEKKIEKYEEAAKKKRHEMKEARRGKKKEKATDKPDSFTEKLVVHLMKNLLVKVRNIHIRYEDSVTHPGCTMAAGVTLHSLELKSTDSNWQPTVVKEAATLIYKLLELNSLGLYWNIDTPSFADLPLEEMKTRMRASIARPVLAPPEGNNYLLVPMSATAKMQLSLKPGVSMDVPMLLLSVDCDDIEFCLQEKQFKSLTSTIEAFDRHTTNQKFLKYRPEVGVAEGAGQWWRYAITAILEEDVKRRLRMWSWSHIKRHRDTSRRYQAKYREKLQSRSTSSRLQHELEELEDQLDVFNIVLLRKQAHKKEKGKKKKVPTPISPASALAKPSSSSQLRKPSTSSTSSTPALPTSPSTPTLPTSPSSPTSPFSPTSSSSSMSSGAKGGERVVVETKKKKKGFFSRLKKKMKPSGKKSKTDGAAMEDEATVATATSEGAVGGSEEKSEDEEEEEEEEEEERGAVASGGKEAKSKQQEEQEWKELYEAIGYSEDDFSEFPNEYVAHKVLVNLKSLKLKLSGKKQANLGTLVTNGVEATILNRPSSKSVSVGASVGDLVMYGVPRGAQPTTLLSSHVGATSDPTPLVIFQLELNPPERDVDIAVKASLRPLQLTYDFTTVDGLIDTFKVPREIHLQELTATARSSWDQLKSQTAAGLQDALKKRKQMEIDVTLQSPFIVLPEGGFYSEECHLVVLSLGDLSLSSQPARGPLSPTSKSLLQRQETYSQYYDTFTIELKGMQALLAKPGDDWQEAMRLPDSPLHILHPTGFQIQLKKSIVADDAYLPNLRVEGSLPCFEISMSDEKLETLLKIMSTLEKPPSLSKSSGYYDSIPGMTKVPSVQLMDAFSLDTMSLSSFGEEDDKASEEGLSEATAQSQGEGEAGADSTGSDGASRQIFTSVVIKLSVERIAIKLTHLELEEGPRFGEQLPLLDISVLGMNADVVDRLWDMQGSVTIHEVVILDYITLDNGEPTKLLRTESVSDGNFITARFVSITSEGHTFSEHVTGLEDSVSAQMAIVRLRLQRQTIARLVQLLMSLGPLLQREPVEPELKEQASDVTAFNPNDVEVKKNKPFAFDVQFGGIELELSHIEDAVMYGEVKGFAVNGRIQPDKTTVSASMKDVVIRNPSLGARTSEIVSKADKSKEMITLSVVVYARAPRERVPQDLSWVDTAITAEVRRVDVKMDPLFLANMLEFVKHLDIDFGAIQNVAKVTADTAAATATAIRESSKTGTRVKLDLTLHAPLLMIPYFSKTTEGEMHVDLGHFSITNSFHLYSEDSGGEFCTLDAGSRVLDKMEIKSTQISVYRKTRKVICSLGGQDSQDHELTFPILEPIKLFTACVVRNLGHPAQSIPNVDVQLDLGDVMFHVHEEGIKAITTIGLAATKIQEVLAPTEKSKQLPEETSKLEEHPAGQIVHGSDTRTSPSHETASAAKKQPVVEVMELKVGMSLNSVGVSLTTLKAPLLKAKAMGLRAEVILFKDRLDVGGSVDSLAVEDSAEDASHQKIVSLAEDTDKVSSFKLQVFLDKGRPPFSPLGSVSANVAQVQVVITVPLVMRAMDMLARLVSDLKEELFIHAASAAQSSASAVASVAKRPSVYFLIDVQVTAPVLLVPLTRDAEQSIMVDLGHLEIKNGLETTDIQGESVTVDAYALRLQSFKISRVLLDSSVGSHYRCTAERVLLQPFTITLELKNCLSQDCRALPELQINFDMGELKVFIGQDDVAHFTKFGLMIRDEVTAFIAERMDVVEQVSRVTTALQEQATALAEDWVERVDNKADDGESGEEKYKKLVFTASMKKFELRVFKDEPELSALAPSSAVVAMEYGLASLQLMDMRFTASTFSNNDVDVQATMADILLADEQKHRQQKKTGNHILQHYTSNPLEDCAGKQGDPIISVSYLQRADEHIILLKLEEILAISDVDFIKAFVDYFTEVIPKSENDGTPQTPVAETTPPSKSAMSQQADPSSEVSSAAPTDVIKKSPAKKIPKLKIEATVKDVRVAILENFEDEEPQALTLKVSSYFHVKVNSSMKQASLNVVDLSIATCSFFNLDNATSWVLLPCTMMASITGPIDTSAMDINVSVDPISLTLSPAVIRLILHAVKTLTPEKVEKKSIVPADLWDKKPLDPSKLWFFSPVQLHTNQAVVAGSSVEKKEESLILTVESIEVILESESTQKSQGHPVLAVNISAVLQASEFTGNFTAKADVQCEASYYNEHVSVWEPLLEPVEMAEGHLCPWNIMTEMKKGVVNEDAPEAKFSVSLSAQSPLQLTMTTTSLQLIKQLAVDCSREYGKKVEGSVKVQSLTGAPITVVNKLGSKFDVIVTPGPNMKLKDKSASARLSHGEDLDIFYLKNIGRRSHASLISRRTESKQTLNILVDGYQELCHVAVAHPGRFYFRLVPTNPSPIDSDCGLVLDIAVTGMKRTITVRSPIQFKNHTLVDLDLLAKSPFGGTKVERVAVLAPDETFSAPIDVAQTHEFFVKPSQPGFEPDLAPLLWLDDYPAGYRDFHCTRTGATQSDYFLRVTSTKETYKSKKTLPRQPFPHHTFDIYPPAVLRNLLPYNIIMMVLEVSHIIKAGEFVHLHDLELATEPVLKVTVIASEQEKLQGKIHLHKRLSEYSKFVATDGKTSNDLSVHVEDFHYRQVAIFSPFWMMNRTGLVLIYREGLLRCKHHPDKEIQLFSTKDPKSKIMLGAITPNKSVTEWTRNFSLNAVGTSGCFSAKLGESTYTFGVEVQLSSFTVTKLVVVTPYYLLVNETESSLHVSEVTQTMVSSPTNIPPGQLVPFWPLCNTNNVLVATDDGAKSIPFDYQKSDFTVLQLEGQLKVLCVEVQDSGSAKVVTFSSYYPGCVPVKIINHFPDITLKFSQDTRSPHAISHYLPPGESLLFTWEDPSGRRSLKWELVQARVNNGKSIDVSKDGQESFNIKVDLSQQRHSSMLTTGSRSSSGSSIGDPWIAVDKTYSESLVRVDEEDGEGEEYGSQVFSDTLPVANGDQRRESTGHASLATGGLVKRGYWKSFIDGLQRVVIFTCDEGVIDRIKAENSYSLPLFEVSLALKALGLSLVDNVRKRELAYIALTQSGLIWQINKGKGQWKTLNTALNSLLEEAYQRKEVDIKQKELAVNIETMEMFAPMTGALRRTHHDAVFFKFEISEKDISVHAKIGYVQVDNQLPFAVYPQVLYPLPPPPTVASTTEPKPFFEASIIMRRSDQSNVRHFKYVHVLVQKMAVNADLGFILALVDFFSLDIDPALLAAELVTNDIEIARKSLKEAVLPQLSKDLESSKNFFDLLHMAPLKITLSFNVRSVGRNKGKNESSVGDRFLQLFLHSLGIILTSVQEADMKFSCFHLEYQPLTGRGLQNYFVKHYRTQALFQLHTLIFGLDVLGNPVSVVKGLVEGTVDLFYEPFKGSVLGPEEFFEGLQIGLKSFLGGTLGGLTGAGAKITGAFGDVFAKLTFDDDFIDKRQVERTKAPRFGRKLGGFAKNLFEGVTGVVTQPVKGLEREGALGLLKGTGKGVAGFFIRPIGGLVDLTSGTLDVVTRKTQVGNIEIQGIRPPRYIGRNGVVVPYSPSKAVGTALLLSVDEGRVAESDYYQGHVQVSKIPHFVLVTDRQVMIVERRILTEGWKSVNFAAFADMDRPVRTKEKSVVISYRPEAKTKKLYSIELQSTDLAMEVAMAINKGYDAFETGDDC